MLLGRYGQEVCFCCICSTHEFSPRSVNGTYRPPLHALKHTHLRVELREDRWLDPASAVFSKVIKRNVTTVAASIEMHELVQPQMTLCQLSPVTCRLAELIKPIGKFG